MEEARPAFHHRLRFDIPAEVDLYEKLKAHQWNASTEIDWSRPVQNYTEATYAMVQKHFSREDFVAHPWRLFHHATASPFGPVNDFLESTFRDIAHRLKLIGLELRA